MEIVKKKEKREVREWHICRKEDGWKGERGVGWAFISFYSISSFFAYRVLTAHRTLQNNFFCSHHHTKKN